MAEAPPPFVFLNDGMPGAFAFLFFDALMLLQSYEPLPEDASSAGRVCRRNYDPEHFRQLHAAPPQQRPPERRFVLMGSGCTRARCFRSRVGSGFVRGAPE